MMSPPDVVLEAWGISPRACRRITSGHINATFRVEAGGRALALQRLNEIFSPAINLDIDAVTRRLEEAGLATPRPVPAADGALWITDAAGATWRAMTWIEGQTVERADSPARCREAGSLLGRFHGALAEFPHSFHGRRLGVHDTPRHLAALGRAVADHAGHRMYGSVTPLAREILARGEDLDLPTGLPERIVHGDPKITNVIFAGDGAARCLVDLDTLARMPVPVELGDALRSWCSPLGEEVEGPLDLEYLGAALDGYARTAGDMITEAERRRIPGALEAIAVELAARFCADALNESYFGWDLNRYGSAAEHNICRARSQLHLARQIRDRLPEIATRVQAAWAREQGA